MIPSATHSYLVPVQKTQNSLSCCKVICDKIARILRLIFYPFIALVNYFCPSTTAQNTKTAMLRREIILLFGRPGSGKGTFAQGKVKEGYGHLSLGDYFRDQVVKQTPLGKEHKERIMNHKPIPLGVVHEVVKAQLKTNAQNGIILDGFPREPESIRFFDELVKKEYPNHSITAVHIQVDPALAEERLQSRKVCEICGRIFGKLSQQNLCCNVKLKPRLDAAVHGRQEGFERKFAASFTHYKTQLIEIDGSKSPEECLRQFNQLVISRSP